MQTFLPYPDLSASCQVLDDRRLGKQRVETFQILRALTWPSYAWKNHPAVTMWRGFVPALVAYGLASCAEWTRRGYADTVADQLLAWGHPTSEGASYDLPPWFGLDAMHRAHQSSLLRKDPVYYRPVFPRVPDDLPYYWPRPVFPRWPVRRVSGPVDLGTALEMLGFAAPLPGQAAVVEAAVAGRDVLIALPPGGGASAAGLLAGLCTPGRTVVVTPPLGRAARPAPAAVDPRTFARVVDAATPRNRPSINRVAAKPSTAKQPGPADRLAMRAEQAPPEWVFRRPGDPVDGPAGLVVLESAARAGAWTRPLDVPVIAITRRAPAARRDALAHRLGLTDPVVIS